MARRLLLCGRAAERSPHTEGDDRRDDGEAGAELSRRVVGEWRSASERVEGLLHEHVVAPVEQQVLSPPVVVIAQVARLGGGSGWIQIARRDSMKAPDAWGHKEYRRKGIDLGPEQIYG
jgi:hypothetical protein